jgi:hypothetical protein
MRNSSELVAADDPQLRPVLFCVQDRGLQLPRQILEGAGVEQRLVELPPIRVAHIAQWRVSDDSPDAAAELGARHWRSVDLAGYLVGDVAAERRAASADH